MKQWLQNTKGKSFPAQNSIHGQTVDQMREEQTHFQTGMFFKMLTSHKLLQEKFWQRGVIKNKTETFPVVHWLRGHPPTQGVQGHASWGTKSYKPGNEACKREPDRPTRWALQLGKPVWQGRPRAANKYSHISKNNSWRQDDMRSMKQGTQHRREGKKSF